MAFAIFIQLQMFFIKYLKPSYFSGTLISVMGKDLVILAILMKIEHSCDYKCNKH